MGVHVRRTDHTDAIANSPLALFAGRMKKELELYLHIPFCVRKCAYCDFLSFPAEKENQNFFEKSIAFSGKSWYYIRVVTTQQNMDG